MLRASKLFWPGKINTRLSDKQRCCSTIRVFSRHTQRQAARSERTEPSKATWSRRDVCFSNSSSVIHRRAAKSSHTSSSDSMPVTTQAFPRGVSFRRRPKGTTQRKRERQVNHTPASSHNSQRAVAKRLESATPEESRSLASNLPFGSSQSWRLSSNCTQNRRLRPLPFQRTTPAQGIGPGLIWFELEPEMLFMFWLCFGSSKIEISKKRPGASIPTVLRAVTMAEKFFCYTNLKRPPVLLYHRTSTTCSKSLAQKLGSLIAYSAFFAAHGLFRVLDLQNGTRQLPSQIGRLPIP